MARHTIWDLSKAVMIIVSLISQATDAPTRFKKDGFRLFLHFAFIGIALICADFVLQFLLRIILILTADDRTFDP